MKTVKTYILSLLALISMAPLQAMQEGQLKQAQSTVSASSELIKTIKAEMSATASQVVNCIKSMRAGKAKEVNTINAAARFDDLINALPASMKEFKQVLITFVKRVKDFDRAPANSSLDHIITLANRVNESCKAITLHAQKAAQIEEVAQKIGAAQKQEEVKAISEKVISAAEAQLLKELAQALHADVEKIVNFDVKSIKASGALKLATALEPFMNRLTGSLSELQEPLQAYISFARLFDNAQDTEWMELLDLAIEHLSKEIAQLRSLPVAQPILIKDDSQKNKKKEVTFNVKNLEQVRYFKKETSKSEESASERLEQLPEQMQQVAQNIANPIVNDSQKLSEPVIERIEPAPKIEDQQLSPEVIQMIVNPVHQPIVRAPRVRIPAVTRQERNTALIATAAVTAPLAVAGVAAGIAAAYDAGYLAPVINAASTASQAVANVAQTVGGQLVAAGSSMGRNLGSLGMHGVQNAYRNFFVPAYAYTQPYHSAMAASAAFVGADQVRRAWNRSAQAQVNQIVPAQENAQRSSVVIEELDKDGNVINAANAVVVPKRKPVITRNRVLATAGLFGGAAGLYTLYNYFVPTAASSAASVMPEMPAPALPQIADVAPVIPQIAAPAISAAATPVVSAVTSTLANVASRAQVMNQDFGPWLAANVMNPWQ